MKDEIKVEEYVRTKTGNITKAISVKDSVVWTEDFIDIHCRYNEGIIEKADIVKHSPNIIDLIEVGDYVNGWQVQEKYKIDTGEWCISEDCGDDYYDNYAYNKDIETVVTKEQFSQMEYKVEE